MKMKQRWYIIIIRRRRNECHVASVDGCCDGKDVGYDDCLIDRYRSATMGVGVYRVGGGVHPQQIFRASTRVTRSSDNIWRGGKRDGNTFSPPNQ